MASTPARNALRRLSALAASDDRAWHDLVAELVPVVEDELARHRLGGERAELVRRATWRALGRRLQLGPPQDVAAWVRQRVAIEGHLTGLRGVHRETAPVAAVERRRADRRSVVRPHGDRRRGGGSVRTPDVVAQELRSFRRSSGSP